MDFRALGHQGITLGGVTQGFDKGVARFAPDLADPIGQLAGLWLAYRPQMQDYLTRALDPTAAPSYGVPGDE